MIDPPPNSDLLRRIALIVSAYARHNALTGEALINLIRSVHTTLNGLGGDEPVADKPQPAVPVKKSIFPDYIICLEDGKKLKTLKRHLRSFGLTPQQYRQRWDLPADYPMVAPAYAARRSALAKASGSAATE